MGYYRGDYYRGDYYRGDFWSKLVKGAGSVLKKIAPVAAGIVGGPLAAAGAAVLSGGNKPAGTSVVKYIQPPVTPDMPGIRIPGTGIMVDPMAALPGGAPLTYTAPGHLGQRPSGYHPRKTTSYRFSDGTIHYAGTEWVKNRQMNPANVRALRRAIRRAKGFEHLARQVISFTSPHKSVAGKKVVFKKAR